MAKISPATMYNWKDGETVTAYEYKKERDILMTAINDNYDRLIKRFEVLDKDGNVKTTINLDTAMNYLKFKEGDFITLSLDTSTGTLQIRVLDGAIGTSKLADGSVTTAKIADGNVTTVKVSDGAITRQKIADAAINLAKLDLNDLDTRYYTESEVDAKDANLQTQITNHKTSPVLDHPDGSVTTSKIANGAVTTDKIANGAITADKIAGSVLDDSVAMSVHRNQSILDHPDGSVVTSKLADSSVTTTKLATEAVTTEKIAAESVTFDKLGLDVIGYIDGKVSEHSADNVKHITAEERAVWNSAEANAKAYTDNQITVNTNKTYVSSTAPTGTMKVGDMWFNPASSTFSIWNGTTWAELSVNNPKGTVNFVKNDARLVIPVGTDKYATS